jgi:hypothetical protein
VFRKVIVLGGSEVVPKVVQNLRRWNKSTVWDLGIGKVRAGI